MVIIATPACPAAGVIVTLRLVPLPPKTMPAFGTNPGLAEVPEMFRLPAGVSRSSTVKSMAGVEVLRRVLVAGMLEITGAVLRGKTVTAKLVLLERAPVSVTDRVIIDVPVWPPAVTLTVRFAPLPPKAMLPTGITVVSEGDLLKVRLVAGSSASPMVNGNAPVDWFTRIV